MNSSAIYLAVAIAGALGGGLTTLGHWPLLIMAAIAASLAAAVSARAERQPRAREALAADR